MGWDRDLLARFRAGEPSALGEVFRQHSDLLVRRLRAAAWRGKGFDRLRSELELENTVLEVFARAFEPRARGVYDGVRPFEHFLMGIARNVLLEEARNREHPSGINGELEAHIETALSQTPEVGLEQQLVDRELEGLLAQFRHALNEQDAVIYQLRFGEELAQEEAAERMGLSRIQLRRRELALKKRLLDFLKLHGYLRDMQVTGWGFTRNGVGS
jgi:RNA polymerase sigma factor (sigma-70 family)